MKKKTTLDKVIKDNMKNPKFKKEYKKQQEINNLIDRLTPRQLQIIEMVRNKFSRQAAAEALGLSPNTVHAHIQTALKICDVNSFYDLLVKLDMVD